MIQRKSYAGIYNGKMTISAVINEMAINVEMGLMQLDAVRLAVDFVDRASSSDMKLRIDDSEKGPVFTFSGGRIRQLQVQP